jgi:hypothetical protein
LQVGGKAVQILIIGQNRRALGPPIDAVPNPEQAQDHRHIFVPRAGAKMFVHGVGAVEQFDKAIKANRQGNRQANG